MLEVLTPLQGTVVAVLRSTGEQVRRGQGLVVVEALKMEHVVEAPEAGTVEALLVAVGDRVERDAVVARVAPGAGGDAVAAVAREDDPHLAELRRRQALQRDEARPDAVAKRHAAGRRTVREDLADLFDGGRWTEWGGLAVAAQRARRSAAELEERTPADGVLCVVGEVDGRPTAAVAYDYAVLAGTQGTVGHLKTDRFLEVVHRMRLPLCCSPRVAAAVPATPTTRS